MQIIISICNNKIILEVCLKLRDKEKEKGHKNKIKHTLLLHIKVRFCESMCQFQTGYKCCGDYERQ